MSKYVVAYLTFFDNDLVQNVVEANSEVEACVNYYVDMCEKKKYPLDPSDILTLKSFNTLGDLQNYCFEQDFVISAIKIS